MLEPQAAKPSVGEVDALAAVMLISLRATAGLSYGSPAVFLDRLAAPGSGRYAVHGGG